MLFIGGCIIINIYGKFINGIILFNNYGGWLFKE